MKANELRIGNLLYNDGVVVTIDARSIFDIWDDKGLKNYKPILLTEDWLLRFGFKKSSYYYEIKGIAISLGEDGRTILNGCGEVNVRHCIYVHQLQNLYFALIGEELILK